MHKSHFITCTKSIIESLCIPLILCTILNNSSQVKKGLQNIPKKKMCSVSIVSVKPYK